MRFSETLDENNQVMASTLLSLSDDYRVRERLANSDADENEDDVQGFGMTVNRTQSALFESTLNLINEEPKTQNQPKTNPKPTNPKPTQNPKPTNSKSN